MEFTYDTRKEQFHARHEIHPIFSLKLHRENFQSLYNDNNNNFNRIEWSVEQAMHQTKHYDGC